MLYRVSLEGISSKDAGLKARGYPVPSFLHQTLMRSARKTTVPPAPAHPPAFSFGVISDIQHAEVPDGASFGGVPRYYANAVALLGSAVTSWSGHGSIDFCLQLGDVLDGKQPRARSEPVLQSLLTLMQPFTTHHAIGNHCLYNLPRPRLNLLLGINNYAALVPTPPESDVAEAVALTSLTLKQAGAAAVASRKVQAVTGSSSSSPAAQPHSTSVVAGPSALLQPQKLVNGFLEPHRPALSSVTAANSAVHGGNTPKTEMNGTGNVHAPSIAAASSVTHISNSSTNSSNGTSHAKSADTSGTLERVSYYSFSHGPTKRWRFIMLDGYDISLLGWSKGHPYHTAATIILAQQNPNTEKNSADGLSGPRRRFVAYGGGIGPRQMRFLDENLREAEQLGQRVIVCCHLPFHPSTCPFACLMYDYQAVLARLQASPVVVATFSGHAHQSGYACDEVGIHHLVLPGVVETPPGRLCHGRVDLYEAEGEEGSGEASEAEWSKPLMVLVGTDVMPSFQLRLRA